MKMVPLGDLMVARTQTLNPSKYADEEFELHSIPSFDRGRPEIALGRVIGSTKQTVEPRDVLVSKIVPHIRRATVIPPASGRKQLASNEWIVFRHDSFDPSYLAHFLTSDLFHRQFLNTVAGVGGSLVRARPQYVRSILAPIPPLDEQRRIAAVLDKADAIRQKRRQAIAHLDTLTQSIFRDRFLQDRQWESAPLGSISDISSGITKGRKTSSALTQSAPYLAVANVQDGKLDLTNLKSIEVSDEELEKYKLQGDDLVLTEGGDPDKLGRGTIWRDELPVCLHQNHIFRIRLPKDANLEVEFLSAYIASWPAKAYFLRSAKQTTGIASINKTQLSKVPIPLPPINLQREFTKLSQQVRIQIAEHERALELADQSFSSLQSRAFRGEL